MAKLSRFHLKPEDQRYLRAELWKDIASLDKANSVEQFLNEFFTPTETVMFAKRLEILKLLRQDYLYGEIKEFLKVTPNTIAKMNNILHLANSEFLAILDGLVRQQKERKGKQSKKRERHHPSKRFWPM